MRRRINENMVWTDSQDYGADEILYIARTALFNKTNQPICEIVILFEVYPQLFQLLKSEERINFTLTAKTDFGGAIRASSCRSVS